MMGKKYGYGKADAIRAERDGVPSLLPDANPWKYEVERHRWGYHASNPDPRCPVCQAAMSTRPPP